MIGRTTASKPDTIDFEVIGELRDNPSTCCCSAMMASATASTSRSTGSSRSIPAHRGRSTIGDDFPRHLELPAELLAS